MNVRPPEAKPDMKGTILGGVTGPARAPRDGAGAPGDEAERGAHHLDVRAAVAKPFPDDVLELVRRNYADEQRHLAWIERALDQRLWEQARRRAALGALAAKRQKPARAAQRRACRSRRTW